MIPKEYVVALIAGILASGGGFYSPGDLVGDPRAVQRCVDAAAALVAAAYEACDSEP